MGFFSPFLFVAGMALEELLESTLEGRVMSWSKLTIARNKLLEYLR